jgi:hypothetical protein
VLNRKNYPSRAKDCVLEFLQTVFRQSALYDGKNEYQWSEDPKLSRIQISDNNTENLLVVEQKPSIIVTRGNMQWMGGALDSFRYGNIAGSKEYKDMIGVDMTLNCFSREGLEAEFLASLVFQIFTIFKQDFRNKYEIHRLDILGLGQESIIQSDSKIDLVAVPVFIKIMWTEEWQFSEQLLQLNKLTINERIEPTHGVSDDVFIEIPISAIFTNPASLRVTNASSNPNLKTGLTFSIVNSTKNHDGVYRIGKIKDDIITLLSPMGGNEIEDPSSASMKILDQSGQPIEGTPLLQEIITVDETPPLLRPDTTG